ncbi:MAG: nucleotidyl transferase AbiEii/AbiGii toxin family protein, partial [Clostridium sp.]|nr:nucleotidyl transferase AbiEii/AbiGii toxin family protein [Clostridium sp.]
MYLHEDRELFREVLDNTRDMTGLPVRIIEKDYYVTVILKLISLNTENAVFKGGTSLSKCYHAISRFSED